MSESTKGKPGLMQGVLVLTVAGGIWMFSNCQAVQDLLGRGDDGKSGTPAASNESGTRAPADPAPKSSGRQEPKPSAPKPTPKPKDNSSGSSGSVSTAKLTPDSGAQKIARAFRNKQSDMIVTTRAKVVHLLPDDNVGIKHQNFLVEIGFGRDLTLKVSHNTDLAPAMPLRKGDFVEIKGEYEYTEKGGVLHWTHHDPRKRREGGYIKLGDQIYQEE